MSTVKSPLSDEARKVTGAAPMTVGPGLKTGMPIRYDDPREVGADRIVNGIAAYDALRDEAAPPSGASADGHLCDERSHHARRSGGALRGRGQGSRGHVAHGFR